MLYLTVKVLHVVLVATALGANISYGVWFARANAQPEFAATAMRGVKFIDDYIANPCYLLLLPTGALMVGLGHIGFGTKWVSLSMTLWLIAILAAYLGYSPVLKRQIAAVESAGVGAPEARALAVRGNFWAAILAVLVLAIVVLMVFKPQ